MALGARVMVFNGYLAARASARPSRPHNPEVKVMKRGKAQKKLAKAAKHCSLQIKRRGGSYAGCIKAYFRKH